MQQHIQSLVKHLFQKDTLEEVTEDELRSFSETHPYSAVGQFLFAKKLQEAGSDQLEIQAERASLYFHNPTWTSWLLLGDHMTWEPITEEKAAEESAPLHVPEPVETKVEEEPKQIEQPVEAPGEIGEQPVIAQNPQPSDEEPAPIESPLAQATTDTQHQETSPQPEEELVFQSYHTIDYFASQGIKLKLEDLTKDKFGKQLKSFTEWLRSMKRATPAANVEEMDEVSRQAIQQFASHSVEGKEAETEAMAEVWAKQGNIAKAIDVYSKLSLLNPAKRAYFAARIEQLKES
jgi:hypothetical protein